MKLIITAESGPYPELPDLLRELHEDHIKIRIVFKDGEKGYSIERYISNRTLRETFDFVVDDMRALLFAAIERGKTR